MLRTGNDGGASAGTLVAALSGVEIALWDTAGKILNAPVSKLLGGQYRQSVKAYWTRRPENPADPSSCREFAAMLKSHPYGFTGIKCDFLPWQTPRDPLTRHWPPPSCGAMPRPSSIFGKRWATITRSPYCHWEWDLIDALNLARSVAPMRPSWLEDPMPPDFSESWVKLTAQSPVPILQGENLQTRHGFLPFIVNQGSHIINIDILKAGGSARVQKIADLADLDYLPVTAHNVASPGGDPGFGPLCRGHTGFPRTRVQRGLSAGATGKRRGVEKFAITTARSSRTARSSCPTSPDWAFS